MKLTTLIFFVIIVGLLYAIVSKQDTIITNQKQMLVNDSIVIDHHLFQDSLYRVHLSTCSFISTAEMTFDKNGYPKLKTPFQMWAMN